MGHFLIRNALGIVALWLLSAVHIGVRPQLSPQQQRQLEQYQAFQQHQAQMPQQDQSPWTTSYWDLGQNIKIDQINTHLEKSTDANIAELQKENAQLGRELSDVEARSSVWFSILGAAVLGALGLAMNNFLKIKGTP